MRKRRFLIGVDVNAIDGQWYDLDGDEVSGAPTWVSSDCPGELILEIEQDDDTGGRPVNCWEVQHVAGAPERDLVAAWIEPRGKRAVDLGESLPQLAVQYRRKIEDYDPPEESRED